MTRIWNVIILFVEFCGWITTLYGAKVNEIKIEKIDENVKVVIFTDAEEYKDFVVSDSERVVIDFMNSVSHLPYKISSPYLPLVRIRTSQYKKDPVPITRIVLDLEHKTPYFVSSTESGVEISLGEAEEPVLSEKEDTVTKSKVKSQKSKVEEVTKKIEDTLKIEDILKAEKSLKVALPESPEPFFYNPRGKRDPFKPYLGIPSKDTLLDVVTGVIVGIMWSPDERYALAEDASGKAFILMEGDAVSGGKVLKIEKQEVVFLIQVFGGTRKVTLQITPRKEKE